MHAARFSVDERQRQRLICTQVVLLALTCNDDRHHARGEGAMQVNAAPQGNVRTL
jgi:hypothetical protein